MKRLFLSLGAICLGGGLGLSAAPAIAHHAFAAEFDGSKPVRVTGTVTKLRFVNPHSWIFVDVKNADGTVSNWGFEFGTPASLANAGLAKTDFRPGTVITLAGFRSKNGGNFGHAVQATLSDGRSFGTGSAPDVPALPGAPARRRAN